MQEQSGTRELSLLPPTPGTLTQIRSAKDAIDHRTSELRTLHAQIAANGTFFEVNLPDHLDYLVGQNLRDEYAAAAASIKARTAKLNAALAASGLQADKFHILAKSVFDLSNVRFDCMDADELALSCKLLDDGVPTDVLREEWPNATVLFDTAFTTTKEWESLRHIGIGGSESSVVMGVNPYTTPRMLYHDKIGTPRIAPAKSENEAIFARGHAVEPKVIETFCKLTGAVRIPETRMFASKTHPHSTANIDAIIRMQDGTLRCFEAKTAVEESRKKWMGDKVPRNYVTQTRQYPAVLADDRIKGTYISCMFVIDYSVADTFINATFDGDRNISHYIERNQNAEEALLEMEDEFWTDYIVPGIEPEMTDAEKDIALFTEIVGSCPTKEFVQLDPRAVLDAEHYLELDALRKEYETKAKEIKKQQDDSKAALIEALGSEAEGRLSLSDKEYIEIRYAAPSKAPECNLEMLHFLYPDAYNRCVTPGGEGAKRFTVKRKRGNPNAALNSNRK